MKKIIFTTIILLLAIPLMATDDDNLWKSAADAYAAKDYETAVSLYSQLVKKGESASLYYNYGNALFKAGYTGRAILYYERALRLDPSNADIKYNLEFANLSKTDKTDRVEEFFLVEWYRNVTRLMPSNLWAYISLALFFLAMVMFLIYRFGSTIGLRKTCFAFCILFVVLTLSTMGHALHSRDMVKDNPAAIVMVGSETARSTPDASGTEVFVIHEGTKVFIKSKLGAWIEVRLEDGNVGWIHSSAVEKI